MHVLKIEYPVPDYDAWNAAFDRDLLDREGSGVRRYRILRPTEDPNYVLIDLDFDDAGEAEAYLAALQRQFYSSREATPVSAAFITPLSQEPPVGPLLSEDKASVAVTEDVVLLVVDQSRVAHELMDDDERQELRDRLLRLRGRSLYLTLAGRKSSS